MNQDPNQNLNNNTNTLNQAPEQPAMQNQHTQPVQAMQDSAVIPKELPPVNKVPLIPKWVFIGLTAIIFILICGGIWFGVKGKSSIGNKRSVAQFFSYEDDLDEQLKKLKIINVKIQDNIFLSSDCVNDSHPSSEFYVKTLRGDTISVNGGIPEKDDPDFSDDGGPYSAYYSGIKYTYREAGYSYSGTKLPGSFDIGITLEDYCLYPNGTINPGVLMPVQDYKDLNKFNMNYRSDGNRVVKPEEIDKPLTKTFQIDNQTYCGLDEDDSHFQCDHFVFSKDKKTYLKYSFWPRVWIDPENNPERWEAYKKIVRSFYDEYVKGKVEVR